MLSASDSQSNSSRPAATGATTSSNAVSVRASKKSAILKTIVALLIPPLGLIMALMIGMDKMRSKKTALVVSLLVASAIGALVYLTLFTGLINIQLADKTKYNYQKNSSKEFSTVQAAGISFSKPTQFTTTAKQHDSNFSTESFAHLSSIKYPLGYIFTFSYKDSHANDKKYVEGINDFMSGAVKNSYRTQYINAIKKQVFDSYPGYSANLGEPQKFTNANIKKNAWSFDLDVTSANPQVKPMKGKLVYALGDGVIYYYALMVTKDNWAPNMATWQTVLGSLKLNG